LRPFSPLLLLIGVAARPLPAEAADPAAPAAPVPPGDLGAPVTQIVVQGKSVSDRFRESANPVTVIETEDAQRESADLGELLARSHGVSVQRSGGLGSESRFSLNGLSDDQIRFFVDGVPLELMGYPFGIENVPVNFVERVDVYQGVVPIRLGADALGGAVELLSDREVTGTQAALSYQVGSFGTQRLTLGGRHLDEPSGWFASGEAFYDYSDNDYLIEVEVPDAEGRLSKTRVPRFHDAYRAAGASLEAGFVRRPWARRLLLRGFVTDFEKELQHNPLMTTPYGELRYGGRSTGATLRYEQGFGGGVNGLAILGYSRNRWDYLDLAECTYDWFGRCIRARREPGEGGSGPRDQSLWDHTAFARSQLEWRPSQEHALRLALSPTHFSRTGNDFRKLHPDARDPLSARRDLTSNVAALEYELDLLDERLENVAFVKHYFQAQRSEQSLPGNTFVRFDRETSEVGFGNALRYRFAPSLYAKASYEWAANLPRPHQIFGNGSQVVDNLELRPERSHNLNLSLTLDLPQSRAGSFDANLNTFVRDAENLIVLLGSDLVFSYQNVFGARSTGLEAAVSWSAPGDAVELSGNFTYLDFRNTSSSGTFGEFEGNRIPNRPFLTGNGSVRLRREQLAVSGDELSLVWYVRYVHEFFRSWESVGRRDLKATIASQLTHAVALTYLVEHDSFELGLTGEVQNLTDARVFDFFGVQRPGRAYYVKSTAKF
jgi:vitamin B12 transporter